MALFMRLAELIVEILEFGARSALLADHHLNGSTTDV
jgi:hypothetical protein